jgi:hypothetical protein
MRHSEVLEMVIDYRALIERIFKRTEGNSKVFKGNDWSKFCKLTEWADNESIESLVSHSMMIAKEEYDINYDR